MAGGLCVSPARAASKASLTGFACNMESWWTDVPFMERFRLAAEHGFSAIEFWHPDVDGRNMQSVARVCRSLELDVVQFTGWGGPSLADATKHSAFADAMKRAVELADLLDAPMFTVVGHQQVAGRDHDDSVKLLSDALAGVVPILEDGDKMAILEPFNPVDHEGHFLNGSADALRICRSIDSPHVKINWDLYHMQLTEGNLVANMRDGADQIGYVQVADVPGRHQPGSGELDYAFIFRAIRDLGYSGAIGLECWPDGNGELDAIAQLAALAAEDAS